MYLNNKQIIALVFPILFASTLLYFQDEILTFMHSQLPTYKNRTASKDFNKEVNEYLNINKERQLYNNIFEHIEKRKASAPWITKKLLYERQNSKEKSDKNITIEKNKPTWNLQAIFPKQNMVIINSKFVSKGSTVNSAKIIKIEIDSVLIKTEKGLKWLHLFH